MRTKVLAIAAVGGSVVALALWAGRSPDAGWVSYLQGDPGRGGRLFLDKGCAQCHAIFGKGGTTAPDLGRSPSRHQSLAELVGVMWNHAPQMWQQMEQRGVRYPELSQRDVVDVFSFLYVARYLDESGDPERGRELLAQKQCDQCHSLYGSGGWTSQELHRWGRYEHPIIWACAMWNHAPAMAGKMAQRGMAWPRFENNEMVDLLCYVRSAALSPRIPESQLLPADPGRGRKLFADKGCDACHAMRGQGGQIGPDLGAPASTQRTPVQLAGAMWNHSPEMWRSMQDRHLGRPQFTEREIADLLAYLYAMRYFDEPGDTAAGRLVFDRKHCRRCHQEDRLVGPSLGRWRGRLSPLAMAHIMWLHGPRMYGRTREMGLEWPRFQGSEMVDLIAYVNEG